MGIEPGIYYRVPFAEYRAWDAVNNSLLGPALRSRSHFTSARLELTGEGDTDAFRFGRLAHETLLEKSSAVGKYIVPPPALAEGITTAQGEPAKSPRSTSLYKRRLQEWRDLNLVGGMVEVTASEMEDLRGVLDAIHTTPLARSLLEVDDGPAELSICWRDPDTKELCKARLDKVAKGGTAIVDLKTTIDASTFERSLFRYEYHRQCAYYLDGMRALGQKVRESYIVVVEKRPPYGCRAAQLTDELLDHGRRSYRRALATIAGPETGYPPEQYFELPSYLRTA